MDLLSNEKGKENNDAYTDIDCKSTNRRLFMNSFFIFDELVDDLLREILLRLPLKSAHRCKSVCKRWFSLVSSPYFVHKYVLFCKSRSSIRSRYSFVFDYLSGDVTEIACKGSSFSPHMLYSVFPDTEREELEVLGSCNDLLLCSTVSNGRKVYHVYNPLTRQRVSLPTPPEHGEHGWVQVGFFCDGILRGFSRLTQHKVFLIEDKNCDSVGATFEIKIFSSDIDAGGGEWSEVSVPFPPGLIGRYVPSSRVFFCNGMLLWGGDFDKIVAYDLHKKPGHCSLIEFPVDTNYHAVAIGARQGRIQLSSWSIIKCPRPFCVWEIEDYNTCTWCLKHKFHLRDSDLVAKVPYIPSDDRSVRSILGVISIDEDDMALTLSLGWSYVSSRYMTEDGRIF